MYQNLSQEQIHCSFFLQSLTKHMAQFNFLFFSQLSNLGEHRDKKCQVNRVLQYYGFLENVQTKQLSLPGIYTIAMSVYLVARNKELRHLPILCAGMWIYLHRTYPRTLSPYSVAIQCSVGLGFFETTRENGSVGPPTIYIEHMPVHL